MKILPLKRAVRAVPLVLMLIVVGLTNALAQSFTVGNLNYTLNGNAATVTGYVNGTGTLAIPETVTYEGNDYPVTAIGNNAFQWAGFTGDLVIPNSVTTIGYSAFYESTSFDGTLTIGNSVTTINGEAFRGCTGFTGDLAIPNSVTTIGTAALLGCNGFNGSLILGNSLTTIGEHAFNGCNSFTGDLLIPNSVTSIGTYAFCGCSGFNGTLTLGGALTSIGRDTFNGCSGFTGALVIPNTVTSIGQSAFQNCSGFTGDLTLPEGLTSIGFCAFSGCSGIDGTLTIPTTVTSIAGLSFDNLTNLSEIHYNATNCGNCSDYYGGQFHYTTGTLVIGENVQRMPNYVFLNAGFTGELILPESLTYLGQGAFKGCSGLTGDLIIPSSVATLGASAFEGCSGFHGILSMPEGLTSIGDYAFSGCSGLTGDLTIPSTVTSIRQYAFSGCSGLNGELTLGENVTSFGNAAFSGCTGLTGSPSIVVTGTIGSDVFNGCSSLTGEITIGEAVTSIGAGAFNGCSGMTAVHYNAINCAGPTNLWNNWQCSFDGCGGVLTIGESVESIPAAMFRNAAITGSLIIPNSVTTIAQLAFYNCTGLTDIRPKSVTPPTLSSSAFDNVDHSIPVYVPCGTTGDYQAASGWSAFTNYEEVASDITVATSNALLGTASIVNHGDCENTESIVLAEPYPGCVFVNWTVDGEEVSTEAEYTFNLAGDIHLVANFEMGPNNYIFMGGGADNHWSTADNWLTNEVPTEANVVSIKANVAVDAEASVVDLYLNNNITMTIMQEGSLMVGGAFNPEGDYNLIIEEGEFWHATDGVTATMTKAIEHYTNDNNGWYLLSLPTESDYFYSVFVQNLLSHNYDFYRYDEPTEFWMNHRQNSFNFQSGQGYLYANDYDVNLGFMSEIKNGTAEVNVPLSYTEGNELSGFNLVGNPYAHSVTSYTTENVAEGCFRLNDDRDDLMVSEISEEYPLQPLEGFFVKAVAEDASVTFGTQRGRGETTEGGSICLEISKEGRLIDRLIVKQYGQGLEKISISEERTKLFITMNGKEMAVVPVEGNEQPIGFKTVKDGSYTLKVNVKGWNPNYLHLIDNMTGEDVDLLANPNYTFEAKTTDYASRFRLVFSVCGDADGDDAPFAFISNGNIIVIDADTNSTLQIMDMTGRVVVCTDFARNVSTSGMASGVYVIRLINGDNVKVQKVVVR